MIADFVAPTIEFAAAFTADRANSHPTLSCPDQARIASSSVETKVTDAAISATRRRSKASASIPPYRPAMIIGTSPTTATIDTANVSPVSS